MVEPVPVRGRIDLAQAAAPADIQAAIDAVRSHLRRGDLSDGLVFDGVRIRLLEIGEAVKALPAEMLSSQPGIPRTQIARLRDRLAHRYFKSLSPNGPWFPPSRPAASTRRKTALRFRMDWMCMGLWMTCAQQRQACAETWKYWGFQHSLRP